MRTQASFILTIEWPTIFLIVVVYLSFFIITYFAGSITLWLSVPLLAIVIAQHSSLQHEILHGHPFQNQRISDLIGSLAIGGLIPYLRFKQTHLQHHIDRMANNFANRRCLSQFFHHHLFCRLNLSLAISAALSHRHCPAFVFAA